MNEQHLIAEFMGLTYEEKTITAPHGSGNDITYTVYYDDSREVQLKYKYSWDALIPVISKILAMYFELEDSVYGDIHQTDDIENRDILDSLDEKFDSISKLTLMNEIDECYPIVVEVIEIFDLIKK